MFSTKSIVLVGALLVGAQGQSVIPDGGHVPNGPPLVVPQTSWSAVDCPRGSVVSALCTSGADPRCHYNGQNYWALIVCRHYNALVDTSAQAGPFNSIAIGGSTSNRGFVMSCPSGYALTGVCSSGTWADCRHNNRNYYTISRCTRLLNGVVLPPAQQSDWNTNQLHSNTWGPPNQQVAVTTDRASSSVATCQSGFVPVGACTTGRESSDCTSILPVGGLFYAQLLCVALPTASPTVEPTSAPTAVPTRLPTAVPTTAPTGVPTVVPTTTPTGVPAAVPTRLPTTVPTTAPTGVPTAVPTKAPTRHPCNDGTHDCDTGTTMCSIDNNNPNGYICDCLSGFVPIAGNERACEVQTETPTVAPTSFPTPVCSHGPDPPECRNAILFVGCTSVTNLSCPAHCDACTVAPTSAAPVAAPPVSVAPTPEPSVTTLSTGMSTPSSGTSRVSSGRGNSNDDLGMTVGIVIVVLALIFTLIAYMLRRRKTRVKENVSRVPNATYIGETAHANTRDGDSVLRNDSYENDAVYGTKDNDIYDVLTPTVYKTPPTVYKTPPPETQNFSEI